MYVIESHGDMIPYLRKFSFLKLKDRIHVSTPRHNNYIHKFEFLTDPIIRTFEENSFDWMLFNKGRSLCFKVQLFHKVMKCNVLWLFPVDMCFVEELNNQVFLNLNGRLIDFKRSEKIHSILCFKKFDIQILLNQYPDIRKILFHQESFFIENRNGSVEKYNQKNFPDKNCH